VAIEFAQIWRPLGIMIDFNTILHFKLKRWALKSEYKTFRA